VVAVVLCVLKWAIRKWGTPFRLGQMDSWPATDLADKIRGAHPAVREKVVSLAPCLLGTEFVSFESLSWFESLLWGPFMVKSQVRTCCENPAMLSKIGSAKLSLNYV
jgi:hypothetical protein